MHSFFVLLPRILVLLVFDQMPVRLWDRLLPHLLPGGLRRLVAEGAPRVGRYDHSITATCPGHALIASGATASRSGIVDNEWWTRRPWHRVHCDDDPRFESSPDLLRVTTFTDVLAESTGGRARIVSLSWKSRGAIMPAGRHPTAVVWYDYHHGRFVTSPYYATELPSWAARANADGRIGRIIGSEWKPSLPEPLLGKLGGPDDAPGEGDYHGLGRTFPHPIRSPAALSATPEANTLIMNLAIEAAQAERLGQDEVPDVLAVSLSATDFVGHVFGPDSREAVDTFFRLDRDVARLLAFLDEHVGAGRYTVVATSDHGATSLPERRPGAVRLPQDRDIARSVAEKLPAGWKVEFVHPNLYLAPPDDAARSRYPEVLESARAALLSIKGVERVLSAQDLVHPRDPVAQLVDRAWDPVRSGDLYVVLAPGSVFEEDMVPGFGTGHGSPREEDRLVPLVFYGAGVRRGARKAPVSQEAAAATMSAILGIPVPPAAEQPALSDVVAR